MAHDRRQDEVAQVRHVDDVAEHLARFRVLEHAHVRVVVLGRGDHEEGAVEVGALVGAQLELDPALRAPSRARGRWR